MPKRRATVSGSFALVAQTQQLSFEVLRVHGGAVTAAQLRPALDRLVELAQLQADAIEQVGDARWQLGQLGSEQVSVGEAGASEHVLAPRFHGQGDCVLRLLAERRDQFLDLRFLNLALEVEVLAHRAGQAWIGSAESDGVQVAQDDVSIAEPYAGCRDLSCDHLRWLIEEVAVVGRGSGVAHDDAHARSATRTSAALGVVVGTRWHVAEHHGFEAADVDAHLQRR
jgi:hypothetical protein